MYIHTVYVYVYSLSAYFSVCLELLLKSKTNQPPTNGITNLYNGNIPPNMEKNTWRRYTSMV